MSTGVVHAVFAAPAATDSFVTVSAGVLMLDLGGIPGDRHYGPTRPAGPREPWMPKGLPLRNDRQLSALSVEELALIAEAMGIAHTAPELVGANLVIAGIANFSRIAPGSHLAIGGAWGGKGKFDGEVILKVEAYNRPCRGPGRKLAAAHGRADLEFAFPKAAAALRGLVLSVMTPGTIRTGDAVVVIDPLVAG
jgi:MOSC domain-containing protein YiiM